LQAKDLSCFGEAASDALEAFFSVRYKGGIVREQQLANKLELCPCSRLQAAQIKDIAIHAIADQYTIIFLKVFGSMLEHHAEEDGEKCWGKDAALLNAIVYREGF